MRALSSSIQLTVTLSFVPVFLLACMLRIRHSLLTTFKIRDYVKLLHCCWAHITVKLNYTFAQRDRSNPYSENNPANLLIY